MVAVVFVDDVEKRCVSMVVFVDEIVLIMAPHETRIFHKHAGKLGAN